MNHTRPNVSYCCKDRSLRAKKLRDVQGAGQSAPHALPRSRSKAAGRGPVAVTTPTSTAYGPEGLSTRVEEAPSCVSREDRNTGHSVVSSNAARRSSTVPYARVVVEEMNIRQSRGDTAFQTIRYFTEILYAVVPSDGGHARLTCMPWYYPICER